MSNDIYKWATLKQRIDESEFRKRVKDRLYHINNDNGTDASDSDM